MRLVPSLTIVYILFGVSRQHYIVLAQFWSTCNPYAPPLNGHHPSQAALPLYLGVPTCTSSQWDCLHLLWAVHLSSDDGHAKRVLALATLNPNWAGANPPSAPPHHHPDALLVEEVVILVAEAPPRPLHILRAMLLELLRVPLCNCEVSFFGSP